MLHLTAGDNFDEKFKLFFNFQSFILKKVLMRKNCPSKQSFFFEKKFLLGFFWYSKNERKSEGKFNYASRNTRITVRDTKYCHI